MTVTVPDIIHCTVFYLKHDAFGDWIVSLSSGRKRVTLFCPPEDGDRIQCLKCVLNKRLDDG
jgi:hypothetical protein